MSRVKRSPFGSHLPLLMATAIVLLVTLFPRSVETEVIPLLCLLCGTYGTSDFLLNVLMFVPLGFFVARMSASARRALLTVVLITVAIELLQMFIPGRYPTLGDVAANTVGGSLGIWALHTRYRRSDASPRRGVQAAAVAAPFVLAGSLVLTVVLLEPALPQTSYYGQWTADLGQFAHYAGQVHRVRVGTVDLPGRRLDPAATRSVHRTADGAPLTVAFRAGPPTDDLAPVFSVFDDHQVEILVIGTDADAIVIRMRRLAETLGLHAPEVRFRNLHPPEGTQATLRFRRHAGSFCVRLEDSETCRTAATPARGWSLFTGISLPVWAPGFLDAAWLALLALVTVSFASRAFPGSPGWVRWTTGFIPIFAYCFLWLLLRGDLAWAPGLIGLVAGSVGAMRFR